MKLFTLKPLGPLSTLPFRYISTVYYTAPVSAIRSTEFKTRNYSTVKDDTSQPVAEAAERNALETESIDIETKAEAIKKTPRKKTEEEHWHARFPLRNRAHDKFLMPSMRNFALPNQPFPMNPYFKPDPPLSDKTRKAIYALFLEDQAYWTPRRLAEQFGIAIVRVQAILRLKALEGKLQKEGSPPQIEFTNGMERLLGSRTIEYKKDHPSKLSEPLKYNFGGSMSQYIRLLDEEVSVTPEDAAKLLQKQPYSNNSMKLDLNAPNIINPPAEVKSLIINRNDRLKNRYKFMVADTSKPNPSFIVRDQSGQLRRATNVELWERAHTRPRKFRM
ncbi:expressed protein [Batrachochytrium dendrobatidis JAM81]|uniref:Expressed protein n=2 Tax=Batrachochytrium dendrobatidis TaxID=109871 RepID=F4PBD4_BATDJ|nr:uncharacterized protein BATDEDRAFT_36008 [Batrachochytrium dendrobatidis JAM81]EGF77304.1 expressed protein [Batrachochytrium dendrobatidis JAM81]KAK5669331.1 hypothetical protein QVD99_003729 [Batrachochytrium dendrobatidis]OAJ37872.1 hypothetical protein BDEG_21844 [Batrachochytrium dendrobatidis JEL423]|eukprot:XP_006681987.1 expressed protein [Batrachochytrium dendrobatidis JAM81]